MTNVSDSQAEFDYIVIGAGSAGSVLAARLSEDQSASVLLIEAGGWDRHPGFRLPLLMGAFIRSGTYNWGYETDPEPNLDNRRIYWPRGKVVGGTSTINGMVYIRGQAADYDKWAAMGLPGWGWRDVLPYFLKSEGHRDRSGPLHSRAGQLAVQRARGRFELTDAFIAAGVEAGYPANDDFNGDRQEGFGRYDFTIRNGKRCSSARAFLYPARQRSNLRIELNALTTRIIVDHGVATAIEYRRGGETHRARARREIIVSAGSINSPQILMLSGIGDAAGLGRHGIATVKHLPAVGRNLQDHFDCGLVYEARTANSLHSELRIDRIARSLLMGILAGTGPATIFPYEGGAFIRTRADLAEPDVQIHFMHGREETSAVHWPWSAGKAPEKHHGFTVRVSPLVTESRGQITLASADPAAAPHIHANYLSADVDIRTTIAGVHLMRKVVAQKAFDRFRGREVSPGAGATSDEAILAWLRRTGATTFHPTSTCRMGADDNSVTDAELRVHGIQHLRVADASVMPFVVSGNTNAPSIMIGEKAADMVKRAWR